MEPGVTLHEAGAPAKLGSAVTLHGAGTLAKSGPQMTLHEAGALARTEPSEEQEAWANNSLERGFDLLISQALFRIVVCPLSVGK